MNIVRGIHPDKVKRTALWFSYTLGLGGISVGLVGVLFVSGLLLMFGYRPTVAAAYVDTQAFASATYPQFLRSLHAWSAYLLLVVALLHLVRVFYHGAFRDGRKTNWMIGVGLLALVFFAAVTGAVLPWDEAAMAVLALFSTVMGAIPFLGTALRDAVFGPSADALLLKAYVFHVAVLPSLLLVGLLLHLWRVRRDGLSGPEGS
jgi:quinol-cytochrome oxidoreductase complex cytochrome b subunit